MDMLRDTSSSSNDDDEVLASLPALDPETNEVIEVGNGGDSEGEQDLLVDLLVFRAENVLIKSTAIEQNQ